MTGPKGNCEFCFPETLNVTRGEAEGNIEGPGETKLTVSRGASHVFCYTSQLKNRKAKCEKNICLTPMHGGWACSTSGSETKLCYRNDTLTVFFFAANKK